MSSQPPMLPLIRVVRTFWYVCVCVYVCVCLGEGGWEQYTNYLQMEIAARGKRLMVTISFCLSELSDLVYLHDCARYTHAHTGTLAAPPPTKKPTQNSYVYRTAQWTDSMRGGSYRGLLDGGGGCRWGAASPRGEPSLKAFLFPPPRHCGTAIYCTAEDGTN